jgi:4-amino-4-deoxy-L-arabinose transferase-like glycosyltransferase
VSLVAALLGLVLFVWDLGSIGLVDETPPLFASSARAMAETGDWLIPQVNGLPRYDKPSALASMGVMVLLSLLMAWWERRYLAAPKGLWVAVSVCFGLSPLVVVWSRIGVSDSLLTALIALAMVGSWWRLVNPRIPWWLCWLSLGLAVLTKGPVALALFGLTWLVFGILHGQFSLLLDRLKLFRGFFLTCAVGLPWYVAAYLRDGQPFLQSFFGYHNLQRFSEVVNNHSSPWWFYGALLLLASLPWSPLLLLGLWRAFPSVPSTLPRFAACWLLSVLLLFSLSATKLPSYWLPATPAAALLASLALASDSRFTRFGVMFGIGFSIFIGFALAGSPIWLSWLNDPDLVGLTREIGRLNVIPVASLILITGSLIAGLLLWQRRNSFLSLLAVQLTWAFLLPFVFLPMLQVGDALRSRPLRSLAVQSRLIDPSSQVLVALGDPKPSLHFYSRKRVVYEGSDDQGLVNVSDRLLRDPRVCCFGSRHRLLVVAPLDLERSVDWSDLLSPRVEQQGRFGLWWLDLRRLDRKAQLLQQRQRLQPTWQQPRPERF